METTLFYFSATGNSLHLTRSLAGILGDCEIVPIAKVIGNESIKLNAPRVGIIFPVYAWGMPRMVEEFVSKLAFEGRPYIFAIATCVAIQGNTLKELKKVLRDKGADLDAGFAVKAGRSSLMKLNLLDKIIIRLDHNRKHIRTGEARITEIAATVEHRAFHKPETSSWVAGLFGSAFHQLAVKTFKTTDSAFVVEDACTGCGQCARLCPRANIVIENNRPVFMHNCELCHACIQWCPAFAIRHPDFDPLLKQYRNAFVNCKDLQIK